MADSTSTPSDTGNRKLVVLGIPWDVDTEGLKIYMSKYGEVDDVIVMKDRITGRSRGFGYVTFKTSQDAEKAMATQHLLNGRMLEVKVATPREDMKPTVRKSTRVFIARIPPIVDDEEFRSYFEKYGAVTDAYMPKDQDSKKHRGIGFITYENSDSVDKLISETHELGGCAIAVDRATPKEESSSEKHWEKSSPAYGLFNSYINAARLNGLGMPQFGPYDFNGGFGPGMPNMWQSSMGMMGGGGGGGGGPASGGGGGPLVSNHGGNPALSSSSSKNMGKRVFIGRIPPEATSEDVRNCFNSYGRILDVYLPKDKDKTSHRGFGFVTFADDAAAERVVQRTHELFGHKLAIDRPTPPDEASAINPAGNFHGLPSSNAPPGAGGSLRGSNFIPPGSGFGNLPWGMPSSDHVHRAARGESRYKPY